MSTHTSETIAALIGSRICHDLISPIGAVTNGLELLALTGVPDGPEMNLVHDSAVSANARIMLFRLAFGLAAPGQSVSCDELCRAWQGGQTGKPVRLIWSGPDSLPRTEARAILLACLCAEPALPQGGEIGVTRTGGDWQLTITGRALAFDATLWGCLSGRAAPNGVTPAQVQFILLPQVLAEMGRQARMTQTQDRLTVMF